MSSFTLTWTDADGATTDLVRSQGLLIERGPIGLDTPPVDNILSPFIVGDGSALTNRRRTPRQIILPFHLEHGTRVQTRVAQLARMLQGPGTLTWSDATNTRTLKRVIYDAGLGGDLSKPASPVWRKAIVSLLALDPWWYGPTESQSLTIAAPTAFDAAIPFDSAIPFDGGASSSISIDGDAEAYPVFTVTGPADTLVVTDGVLAWQLAAALGAGQTLIVDTRPGTRGPRLSTGSVDWSLLTGASRLWSLSTSTTSITASVTGSTGATSVIVQWEPRWLTP